MATTRIVEGGAVEITLPLAPVPASRPRVGRYGTYYPKTYKTWMAEAAALLPTARKPRWPTGPVEVSVVCVCKRPQKPTRDWPRGDIDNYAKAILDAITKSGTAWGDDDQIVLLGVSKRYAREDEEPHTLVWAMPAEAYPEDDIYSLPAYAREPYEED